MSVITLGAASPQAERILFGPPDWTVIASVSTNVACTGTATGVANKQHFLTHFTYSCSAANTSPVTITVVDNTSGTVIWQDQISTSVTVFTENFETRPLRASVGNDLVVTATASGGTTTCTISFSGFTVRAP